MALPFQIHPKVVQEDILAWYFNSYSSIKRTKPSTKPELGGWGFSRLICIIMVTVSIYHCNLEKTKSQFQSISIETSHLMYCQAEKHCSYFEMRSILTRELTFLTSYFCVLRPPNLRSIQERYVSLKM